MAAACLAFLLATGPGAQTRDEGKFEVLEASHELVDGEYRVDALIYLRLPSDVAEALRDSSQPLTIRVEVEFLNRLWFWWDSAEFTQVERHRLNYNSLTDRYIVRNEGKPANGIDAFPTLAAALEHIGHIDDLPVVAAGELDRDLRYDIRIRAVLDQDDLPGPLRLISFWRNDWSIGSEWLQWRLDEE